MKKRIIALALALCMIAAMSTVFASAAGTFTATIDSPNYSVGQNAIISWNYYPTDGITPSFYEVYLNGRVLTSTSQSSILYNVDGSITNLQFYVIAYGYENGNNDHRQLGVSNVVTATVTGTQTGVYFVEDLTNVQPYPQSATTIYVALPISVYLPSTVYSATWTLWQTNRLNQVTRLQSGNLTRNNTNNISTVDYAITANISDIGNSYYYEINYSESQMIGSTNLQQYVQYQQQSAQMPNPYSQKSIVSQIFTLSQYSASITSSLAQPAAGASVTLNATIAPLFNNYMISSVSYQWYAGLTSSIDQAAMIYGATSPTYAFTLPTSQGTYYYFCKISALIDGQNVTNTVSKQFTIAANAGNMANFKQINSGKIPFTDIASSAWYYSYASYAYYLNLMQGSSATTFNPNGNFKISEAIAVAARMHAIYNTGTDSNFVQGTVWYQTYVDYAVKNGIIKSTDFTDYTAACTRAQMAYILCNALPQSELSSVKTVSSLPDVTSYTPYSSNIFTLYNAGVLTGSDKKGTFYPQNGIKRSEVSAIICRMAFKSMRSSTAIG